MWYYNAKSVCGICRDYRRPHHRTSWYYNTKSVCGIILCYDYGRSHPRTSDDLSSERHHLTIGWDLTVELKADKETTRWFLERHRETPDNPLDRHPHGQTTSWTDKFVDRQPRIQTTSWTDNLVDNLVDRQVRGQTTSWAESSWIDNLVDRQPRGQPRGQTTS